MNEPKEKEVVSNATPYFENGHLILDGEKQYSIAPDLVEKIRRAFYIHEHAGARKPLKVEMFKRAMRENAVKAAGMGGATDGAVNE
jgi:hypothetical protein